MVGGCYIVGVGSGLTGRGLAWCRRPHARYTDTAYYVTGTADLLGMAAERGFAEGGVA
jgi:hypothetical protein